MEGQAWDALARHYEDREQAARQRRLAGTPVVGVLGATVPVEVVTANGMIPVRLVGDPRLPIPLAERWTEPIWEGALRSILQKLLAGDYAFLDLLVVPRSSEAFLQFYHLVEHIRTLEPGRKLPDLYLFDLLQTRSALTETYVTARIEELDARLARIPGAAPSAGGLLEAIELHNAIRDRVALLDTRRTRGAPTLSGLRALQIAGCGQTLPPADVLDLCAALEQAPDPDAPREARSRVFLSGMTQGTPELYRAIEAAGASVVGEDHDWGVASFRHRVDTGDAPHRALARRYIAHAPSMRRFPEGGAGAEILARTGAAGADAVIFALEANDDTLGWDYPAQRRALDAGGVPSLRLTGLTFGPPAPATVAAIERFIDELAP